MCWAGSHSRGKWTLPDASASVGFHAGGSADCGGGAGHRHVRSDQHHGATGQQCQLSARKNHRIWVAHNRLVEIQLQTEWPDTGKSDGEMQMADQDWRWETEVEKTPEEELRRVEVRVYHPDDETRASMAQLSAFIGRLSAAR